MSRSLMLIIGLALAGALGLLVLMAGDRGVPEVVDGGGIVFASPFRYDVPGDDARDLNDEVITIANRGAEAVDMTGWSLRSDTSLVYRFPRGFVLEPGARVSVHSGCGRDSREALYWCSMRPVWDDDEGEATLLRPNGSKAAVYPYKRF